MGHSSIAKQIELLPCTPAKGYEMLSSGEADLGIIPSITIPSNDKFEIVSDYCIGANGSVASVLICSSLPLTEIETLYLDTDSRTSVALTKILASKYWGINPLFVPFDSNNEAIDYDKSYLLIGDKAMEHSPNFEFCYDLAFEWRSFTEKPFVFACWTASKKLDQQFLSDLNEAFSYGVSHINESLDNCQHPFSKEFAYRYLTENISYKLDKNKLEGLSAFWKMHFDPSKFRVRW